MELLYDKPTWIHLLMGSALLITALSRAGGLIELRVLTLSIRDSHYEQIKNNSSQRFYLERLPIRVVYYAMLTVLLLEWMQALEMAKADLINYLLLLITLLLFLAILHFLRKAASAVFKFKDVVQKAQVKEATNTDVITLTLLFTNLFLLYPGNDNVNYLIAITGVVVIVRVLCVFRLLLYFRQYILDHLLYFILYLCALEIAPYLLLYSVLLEF